MYANMSTTTTMTWDSLKAIAIDLGTQAGKGKDTQVKFLLAVVEAAYHGIVDLTKNKHGQDIDDAIRLSELYTKAQGTTTIFDAKAPNQRKLASCVRVMEKVGMWPKGGTGEPLATINNLMTIRQKLRADPLNAKLLDDAANTVIKYARLQIKRDQLIGEDELKTFCFKGHGPQKTAEQLIQGLLKDTKALIEGKAQGGTVQDASTQIKEAAKLFEQRLTNIAKGRAEAKKTVAKVAQAA